MDQFWAVVQDNLSTIISSFLALIISCLSFLVTYLKTRKKALEKRISSYVVEKNIQDTSLNGYYVVVDNKRYYLKDLEIHKEVLNGNEKKS